MLFYSLTLPCVQGQEVQPIDFTTVLELCDAQNLTIQEYTLQQELANAQLDEAKGWWLPDLYGGFQGLQEWGAGLNTDGKFALNNDKDMLWMGLGIDATWNLAEGIFTTKGAKLKNETYRYMSQANRNKTILQAIDTYYDLLSAQLEKSAYVQLESELESLTKQVEVQVKGGLGYTSDLLISKSNLNHIKIKILDADASWATHSATLSNLLSLDPTIQLLSIDTSLLAIDLVDGIENIDLESSYEERPELAMLRLQKEAVAQEKNTVTKGLFLPELRLNAYISRFGDLENPVSPIRPDLFPDPNQLYPTQAISGSILWRIPIDRIMYKGEVKQFQSQLLLVENKMAQQKLIVNNEVTSAQAKLKNAKLQITLAQESQNLAEEALSQSIAREKLGVIRPFEILQAQEVYIQARLDHIHAIINHNVAAYALYIAMGKPL